MITPLFHPYIHMWDLSFRCIQGSIMTYSNQLTPIIGHLKVHDLIVMNKSANQNTPYSYIQITTGSHRSPRLYDFLIRIHVAI